MGRLFDRCHEFGPAQERETSRRRRNSKPSILGLAGAVAVCIVAVVGVVAPQYVLAAGDPALGPRVRHNPPNQHKEGSCIHNHYLDPQDPEGKKELAQNECEAGGGGKPQPCQIVKDGKKLKGTCETKKNGRPSPNCVCVLTSQQGMESALRGMYEATKTASLVMNNAALLGLTTACAQFFPLTITLRESLDFVTTMGPTDIGDSEFLGIIDTLLLIWPQIGSFANSCGTTFPDRTNELLQIKSEMISAFINGPAL